MFVTIDYCHLEKLAADNKCTIILETEETEEWKSSPCLDFLLSEVGCRPSMAGLY